MKLLAFGNTDKGLVRPRNEDRYSVNGKLSFFGVADGMGGHAAGEIASEMALDVIIDHLQNSGRDKDDFVGEYDKKLSIHSNRLVSAIRLANKVILEAARNNSEWSGMGTTVAAVWKPKTKMSVAHVGDSRVYLYRGKNLRRMTEDHSIVGEQIRQGILTDEEAERSGMRNIITRALGHDDHVQVDVSEFMVQDNDRILICTDGLTSMVPDSIIKSVLNSSEEPTLACDTLIDVANKSGGRDNIAVVLVYCYEKNWRFAKNSIFDWARR